MKLPSLPHLRAPWTPCASTPRTCAGGFQMVSLLHLAQITEEGVTFQSPVDGSSMLLTPEASVTIQNQLGADILMALDDVVSSVADSPARFAEATERTTRWIDRCIAAHARPSEQSLFAIVQVRRRHSAGPPGALPPGSCRVHHITGQCTATSFGLASVSNPLEPRFEPFSFKGLRLDCAYPPRSAQEEALCVTYTAVWGEVPGTVPPRPAVPVLRSR